jgi:UDP-N-acetylglucosamine 2-epimerase (non-hydrolysing)
MPEEINRVLTDQLSDLLFVTEESALRNLQAEGIARQKVHFVGNTMIDSLRQYELRADLSTVLQQLRIHSGQYVLLTLHRAGNVDERESFVKILSGLQELAATYKIIFPVHPRTQKQVHQLGLEPFFVSSGRGGIEMIPPQPYIDFLCLMKNARLVVTDSGGIQEETTALRIPCVTVRDNTERPITLDTGMNMLGGTRSDTIRRAVRIQLSTKPGNAMPELWDGNAATRIVKILADTLMPCSPMPFQAAAGQIQQNAR